MHKKANRESLSKFKALSKKELLKLHNKNSQTEIAKIFNISRSAIQNQYKKLNIQARNNCDSQKLVNQKRFINLTYEQEQLIYGSLLGDACLSRSFNKTTQKGKTEKYRIYFTHSKKQLSYLKHKKSIIGNGVKCKNIKLSTRTSGHGSKMYGFNFQHTPTLIKVAKICHNKNHKKIINKKWLNKIDLLGIAYWYQDDGCLIINKRKNGDNFKNIIFYTNSYNLYEIKLLQNLLSKFGLNTKTKNGNNSKERVIICSNQSEINAFLNKLKPFIVDCMKYKIRDYGTKKEWLYDNNCL